MRRTKDWRADWRCLCAVGLAQALCPLALALCPLAAAAQGVALSLSLEPGVAVGGEQAQGSRLPSAASLRALLGVGRYLDLSIGAGFVGLPNLSDSASPMSGMASTFGAGLRLKRPRDERSFGGASPWVDTEVLSVQGAAGDRRALAVGAGVAFPLGRDRSIWLGPFVRYLEVMEVNVAAHGARASDGLFAGLTFEVSFSLAGPAR